MIAELNQLTVVVEEYNGKLMLLYTYISAMINLKLFTFVNYMQVVKFYDFIVSLVFLSFSMKFLFVAVRLI